MSVCSTGSDSKGTTPGVGGLANIFWTAHNRHLYRVFKIELLTYYHLYDCSLSYWEPISGNATLFLKSRLGRVTTTYPDMLVLMKLKRHIDSRQQQWVKLGQVWGRLAQKFSFPKEDSLSSAREKILACSDSVDVRSQVSNVLFYSDLQ